MGNINIEPVAFQIVKFRAGPREIAAFLVFSVMIILVILINISPGTEEIVEPDMEIEVVSTYIHNGSFEGTYPVDGKVWQMVIVNLTNNNDSNSIEISVAHFYGEDDRGEKIWVFNAEDYDHDPVEPGETGTILLVFMIDQDNTLKSLEYTRSVSGPVECSVPGIIF